MNWWAIFGVICVVGLAYAFYMCHLAGRSREAFWTGFFVGSFGCAGIIVQLFAGLFSLYVLYLFFSWIFG